MENSRQNWRVFERCNRTKTACCINNNHPNRPSSPLTSPHICKHWESNHLLSSQWILRYYRENVSLFNCETCNDDDIVEIFSVNVDSLSHTSDFRLLRENVHDRRVNFHNCEPTKPQNREGMQKWKNIQSQLRIQFTLHKTSGMKWNFSGGISLFCWFRHRVDRIKYSRPIHHHHHSVCEWINQEGCWD